MKILALILILGLSTHCTKNQKSTSSNETPQVSKKIVNYQSPINFTFSEDLKNKDLAYKVDDFEYSLSQLFRSNRSLLRLVTQNKNDWVVSAYLKALEIKNKGQAQVSVELPFTSEGIELEKVLQNNGVTIDTSIQVGFSEKDLPHGLTKINNKDFDEVELSKQNLNHARNLQKIFNLTMKAIETKLSRALINKAALAKKQNFNQFVDENSQSPSEIGEEQVKTFAKENSIPEKDLDEKMTKTIKQIISSKNQSQVFVTLAAKILKDKPVPVAIYRPYIKINSFAYPQGTPKMGSGQVDVALISNFLCKRCVKTEQKITELLGQFSDKIQLSYLFQIRPEERISKFVAEAGLCVHKMDQSKFWELHKETFKEEFTGNESTINGIVESMGLSIEELRKCFASRESNEILSDQLQVTSAMKTLTLPILVINGNIFENPKSTQAIENLINYEFKNSKDPKSLLSKKKGLWAWLKSLFT